MKTTIAIVSGIGFIISMFVWIMMIFTGACFSGHGFSSAAIITFLCLNICGITSLVTWVGIIVEKIRK